MELFNARLRCTETLLGYYQAKIGYP